MLHVLCGSFVGPSFKVDIQFDTNAHLVFEGECRESLEEIKNMVVKEVLHMPNATSFAISLVASKTYLVTISMTMGTVLLSFLRVKNSIKPC